MTMAHDGQPMAADIMTLFYGAQRCGSVVLTSSASDDCDESYVDPTKNSLVPIRDTSQGGNASPEVPWSVPLPSSHDYKHKVLHHHTAGVCTISPADAIIIFVAKQQNRKKRDRLASSLGHKYRITSKAVRDIWSLRTWCGTTRPYWTELDAAHFAHKRPSKTSTAVKVTVEPTPSQDAIPASDVEEGVDVQSVHDEQEDLMLPEHDDAQDAVHETQAPSTANQQAHAASTNPFETCEWLIDSAILAQEFEEIFLAWHHSSARRDCMEM
jgi:hypothetical protein